MFSATNIIEFIEGQSSITLTPYEKKWIINNFSKTNLHFEHDKNLFIKLEDITSYQKIIQNKSQKTLNKVDTKSHALVISYSGKIQLYVPN